MKELEIYDKNIIGAYIAKELTNREISSDKKVELKIIKGIYIDDKSRKEVIKTYKISSTTLWRIEKRFYEAFSNDSVYANIKLNRKKLTDSQNAYINKLLKKDPIYSGLPFVVWDNKILRDYIKIKFSIEFSERQCQNIINHCINTKRDNVLEYINKKYKEYYIVDIFQVAKKDNSDFIKKKTNEKCRLQIMKKFEKIIYTALLFNGRAFGVSEAFDDTTSKKDILLKLFDLIEDKFKPKKKALLIFRSKDFSLNDMIELNGKYKNLEFLCAKTQADLAELAIEDLQDIKEIKRNILKQVKFVEFSYNGRYKEKIDEIIKKS